MVLFPNFDYAHFLRFFSPKGYLLGIDVPHSIYFTDSDGERIARTVDGANKVISKYTWDFKQEGDQYFLILNGDELQLVEYDGKTGRLAFSDKSKRISTFVWVFDHKPPREK
ncbi:MAG: hypothetical protein EOP49_38020 [Sphingobacteriales bacterium]|nr:MAG: hypothetical protein EOP49_38020 [Sphingobacteriales bacterium]